MGRGPAKRRACCAGLPRSGIAEENDDTGVQPGHADSHERQRGRCLKRRPEIPGAVVQIQKRLFTLASVRCTEGRMGGAEARSCIIRLIRNPGERDGNQACQQAF